MRINRERPFNGQFISIPIVEHPVFPIKISAVPVRTKKPARPGKFPVSARIMRFSFGSPGAVTRRYPVSNTMARDLESSRSKVFISLSLIGVSDKAVDSAR